MKIIESNLKKDINTIIQKFKKSKSMSTYIYNLIDLYDLYDLCDMFNISYVAFDNINYTKLNEFNKKNFNNTFNLFSKNIEFIDKLSQNIINALNNILLFPLNPTIRLDYKDIISITEDFLKDYNISILNSLLDCIKKKKVLYYDDFEEEGLTHTSLGNNFSPYIILDSQNTITTCITLAHEATHTYYRYYRNLFKNSKELNIINSAISEIPAYTLELYFFEWLKSKKICLTDNYIIKNHFFYLLLDFSTYFNNLFNNSDFVVSKSDFANIEEYYSYNIDTFIGKAFACYFYDLNDIEKANYLINKLFQNNNLMSLKEIIEINHLDYENIINFESGKKLIKKIYDNGGINREKI